ncbi:MAG: enoyl-CoA hydratase/isomerase family protein [Anaerolineales bacterium]|nr:enoyl-CoA hydratase/isomerase family protein [Anaerolineales bacterium]
MATDIRWAAESASFSFAFTRIGLAADSGTSVFLPMVLGLSTASEFAFGDRMLTAEEAYRDGLVSRVFPDSELHQEFHDMLQSSLRERRGRLASQSEPSIKLC